LRFAILPPSHPLLSSLLQALHEVQGALLRGSEPRPLFERLLSLVVEVTGCQGAVVGEWVRTPSASLRVWARTPASEALGEWLAARLTPGSGTGAAPAFHLLPVEVAGERLGGVGLEGARVLEEALLRPLLDTCGSLLWALREREARLSEHRLEAERQRALLEAMPDLLFRVHVDGTILDFKANEPGELYFPRESVIGSNVHHMPEPVGPQLMEALERAVRGEGLQVIEYVLEVSRGWQYYEARLLRSGPHEGVFIVRNISDRKKAEERLRQQEEELRHHRDHLEDLVEERTRALRQAKHELEAHHAQLVQNEKLASLGQMAAGVAHEINNPVSYVLSNLGTLDRYVASLSQVLQLQKDLLDLQGLALPVSVAELLGRLRTLWVQQEVDYILDDMPELVRESHEGTRHIKEIAQGLRTFAREDSGEQTLVDVNAELESTLKIVWNQLKYKCEVKRDFGELPQVSFHATQLTQVFANLLVNAAQAIETRGEIHIATRQEGGEVVVDISDTGHGMSQETLSKLFQPFFTTKPRGKGTGLGLSISYGIITRHKGRIDVRSEPGKGSTFTVRLPVAA